MSTYKEKGNKHSMSSLFIFLLIGMFAIFLLMLVMIGVGAYRGVVDDVGENEQVRTTLDYIANKVRAADAPGTVWVEEWHGLPTLVLEEEYDRYLYETRIYFWPGDGEYPAALYEHFSAPGDDWGPENGEKIVEIGGLTMEQEGELLHLTLKTKAGEEVSLTLRLRAQAA